MKKINLTTTTLILMAILVLGFITYALYDGGTDAPRTNTETPILEELERSKNQ